MGKQFSYQNIIKWSGEKKGIISCTGKPQIESATPPEFRGHEGIWSPEDMFVASVNTCVMTTFLHLAEKQKIDFKSYEGNATGVLEQGEGGFAFTKITVFPKVEVENPDMVEKTRKTFEMVEKHCLISNSIKAEVKIEPKIETK